jgi:hypothetical protein
LVSVVLSYRSRSLLGMALLLSGVVSAGQVALADAL